MSKAWIKCESCDGIGYISPAFIRTNKPVDIDCIFCNGEGFLFVDPDWITTGKILHDLRKDKKITLRDACKLLEVDVLILSKMEKGVIEPNKCFIEKLGEIK